jgi:electron transfer flavoprotein alpha subunit
MNNSLYSPAEANNAIWVWIEEQHDQLANVSIELLSKCRSLADEQGWPLVGLLITDTFKPDGHQAISRRVDELILIEHEQLGDFSVEGYTQAAYEAILAFKPGILILGATVNGRDLAGRLAVRLRTGLNADCTDLEINPDTGNLVCQVSGFGGGILALIETATHRPQMATVRPGVYKLSDRPEIKKGNITRFQVDIPDDLITTTIVKESIGDDIDLTQAEFVIAGGRGMDGRFDILSELAQLLGGEVGATRPPVDEGHIDRERQIGQTGIICRPKLAIACGISGAFHFIVGIDEADTVIAVNVDPEAPIFEHVDYYVVADALEIMPRIVDIIKSSAKVRLSESDSAVTEVSLVT